MKEHQPLTSKASLDWNSLNSDIKISYTKKKFFNQYYFRLNYQVPGARLMTYGHAATLADRVSNYNNLSWRNMFRAHWHQKSAELNQIVDFYNFYHTENSLPTKQIKFRIECDTFSIYADCENQLYEIASKKLGTWTASISSVSLISSQTDFALLDQGHILVSKPQTHPYRVKIKETFNFPIEREALLTYLGNLGDHVRVTKFMLRRLAGDYKYFPGGYIHVDDPRLIDMLKLIAPNLVGAVNQLVHQ